jgi:hypothetical protein
MKHIEVTDAITNAQNEGKPCPHCGSRFGHYSICSTIGGSFEPSPAFDPVASAVLVISEGDAIALHALGVKW